MEPSITSQSTMSKVESKNPIPVIGVESKLASENEDKISRIAVSAYYKAEARGYAPGNEIQDWLEAEAEVEKSK